MEKDDLVKNHKSDDSLAALPALGQGAPWPTRVPARAGTQAMIYPVKYRYLIFQIFSSLPIPHIQRCNWIANNLTGQGMQRNTADALFTKSSKKVLLRFRPIKG
jgi:hypothetical protein